VTLLAFAADCCAVASAAASLIMYVRTALSRKPATRRGCSHMLGQMDGCKIMS